MEARPCPVCGVSVGGPGWEPLARHLVSQADNSDAAHVMWMNRTVTKHRTPAHELAVLLEAVLERGERPDGTDRVER